MNTNKSTSQSDIPMSLPHTRTQTHRLVSGTMSPKFPVSFNHYHNFKWGVVKLLKGESANRVHFPENFDPSGYTMDYNPLYTLIR